MARSSSSRVLGLEDDPAAGRAVAGVDRNEHVAGLAGTAREVANRLGVIALRDRQGIDGLGHELLEGAALGGPALTLGLDRLDLRLLVAQALQLLLELGHLAQQRLLGGVLALLGTLDRPGGCILELGQRVGGVTRGERAHQVLARLGHRLGHELAHAVLDRAGAAVGEQLLELLGLLSVGPEHLVHLRAEELGDLAGLVGELGLERPRGPLELRLHELRVGGGLLAVEHASADLDGVGHRPDGVVAGLLALAHEPHGALVLDHEGVDDEPVAGGAHRGLPEWGCCFHDLSSRTLGTLPDGMRRNRARRAGRRGFA